MNFVGNMTGNNKVLLIHEVLRVLVLSYKLFFVKRVLLQRQKVNLKVPTAVFYYIPTQYACVQVTAPHLNVGDDNNGAST